MRTEELLNGAVVHYPDEVTFAYNKNKVVVDYPDGDDVKVHFKINKYEKVEREDEEGDEIYDIATIFEDERVIYNGKAEIDLSAYMRYCFSRGERHQYINVNVIVEDETFFFDMQAIWGALNIGEDWNTARRVTWFSQFPQKLEIYVPADATLQTNKGDGYIITPLPTPLMSGQFVALDLSEKYKGVRVINGVQASTFDETFDITFGTYDVATWTIDQVDSEGGVYLRWVDAQGWQQYWLFVAGTNTTTSSNNGSEVPVDYSDDRSIWHEGVTRQSKNVARKVRCCAVNLNETDRGIVGSVIGSPYVDMWNGRTWIPVNISATSISHQQGNNLVDYEIEVVLPNIITQQL